eukprot:1522659-Alexandrium_andersonii.AAC.1
MSQGLGALRAGRAPSRTCSTRSPGAGQAGRRRHRGRTWPAVPRGLGRRREALAAKARVHSELASR